MAEAAAAVEENIVGLVAAAMGISLEEADTQKPLYDYGGKSYISLSLQDNDLANKFFTAVDSLQAIEIRNRALKNMRSDISVFDILSALPLADLAAKIAAKSQLVKVTAGEY
jgi:hypothetical protein